MADRHTIPLQVSYTIAPLYLKPSGHNVVYIVYHQNVKKNNIDFDCKKGDIYLNYFDNESEEIPSKESVEDDTIDF